MLMLLLIVIMWSFFEYDNYDVCVHVGPLMKVIGLLACFCRLYYC